MAAQRPLILAALKTALVSGVTLVAGRVYLPWDALPEIREVGSLLQIEIVDGQVDDSESIGQWLHRVQIRIGGVKQGAFDYPAVWELLNQTAATLRNSTLGSLVQRCDITGTSDHVEQAGDRILWPHLAVEIVYLTSAGSL